MNKRVKRDERDGLQQGRSLLLLGLAAVATQALSSWQQVLARAAATHGCTLHWRGLLADPPAVGAVRVAHALEMGPPGLQAWHARWPHVGEAPALQLAAAAAGLLAGREPLLILVAAVNGASDDAGALVDGESCARMAVAGFDPETEIRLGNCAELLASAGDVINIPALPDGELEPTQHLILGLKWHAPAGD